MDDKEYFQSYQSYFWQWEDDGEVLAILNGSTIAYKAFVLDALKHLADQGLPPFGSLLLSIIATNPSAETALNSVCSIFGDLNGHDENELYGAVGFLKLLADLPPSYKEGKSRLLVFQALFTDCHNIISLKQSRRICDLFDPDQPNDLIFTSPIKFESRKFYQDFRTISLLHKRFPDVQSILESLASLPQIEEEFTPVVPLSDENNHDFLQQLLDEPKTFHVGALIRHIWSGLHIPFHNKLPSQQPIGGVSDLTSKGTYDQLLITEFAHEDIILLSRLANSEALYLNREVPPISNDKEHIILVDISMKSWGTPKTIAFALLLALAKHPKSNVQTKAFVVGSTYKPLPFESIHDIIDGVQNLDGVLHPVSGIAQYFKEFGKQDEVILISSKDTMGLPEMQKLISEYHDFFSYYFHTDNLGRISFYKRQGNQKKSIQEFTLPLNQLWKKNRSTPTPDAVEPSSKYPLLLPCSLNPRKVLSANDGSIFLITTEKNILRLKEKEKSKKGWELFHESRLTTVGETEIGLLENGNYVLLNFIVQNREIIFLNLSTGEEKRVSFEEWKSSVYPHFLFLNNRFHYLYLGYPSKYWTFEIGEEVQIVSYDNIPKEITTAYKNHTEALKEIERKIQYTPGILKNIKEVFINQIGNLVFNIHELYLNPQGIIKLQKTGFLEKKHIARSISKNEFEFQDESKIIIHRTGVLQFKSSDQDIPTIYIPSVVETSLGITAGSSFAGNEYYHNPHLDNHTVIAGSMFWRKYVEPFIETIQQRGTQS